MSSGTWHPMEYPSDMQRYTDRRLRDQPDVVYDHGPPMYEPWCCCPHGHRNLTVEHWRCVLVEQFGCDHHAVERLVLLSHLSPAGYKEAVKVIWKVKNYQVSTGQRLHNVSSYVVSNVKTAFEALTPEGRVYANKGTGRKGGYR